jgi:hypothetical protein
MRTECSRDCRHLGRFRDCLSREVYAAWLDGFEAAEEGGWLTGPGRFVLLLDMESVFPDAAYLVEEQPGGPIEVFGFDSSSQALLYWYEEIRPGLDEWRASRSCDESKAVTLTGGEVAFIQHALGCFLDPDVQHGIEGEVVRIINLQEEAYTILSDALDGGSGET